MRRALVQPAVPIRLGPNRTHEAGEALGRACADDPLVAALLPGSDLRTRRSLAVAGRAVVRFGERFGEVYATEGLLDALAVWLPPVIGLTRATRAVWALATVATLGLPAADLVRLLRVARELRRARVRAVPGPHWELAVLGIPARPRTVDPTDALLHPVLVRADAAGVPCYVATVRAQAVLEFVRHGFAVVSEGCLPGTDLRYWSLVRPPRVDQAPAEPYEQSPDQSRTEG